MGVVPAPVGFADRDQLDRRSLGPIENTAWDFVQRLSRILRRGFLHRRLVWDVGNFLPGPGEKQECPSRSRFALRADLRFGVGWPAAHKEEGPKAGI